jgi:hypothetical protein
MTLSLGTMTVGRVLCASRLTLCPSLRVRVRFERSRASSTLENEGDATKRGSLVWQVL